MISPVIGLTPPHPDIVSRVTQRLAFGATADDATSVQHDLFAFHSSSPFQRPVNAAAMQSRVDPNQASMPIMAVR